MLATVADLLDRWDSRLVDDLAGDPGAPGGAATSPRVAAALRGASGEVRAAALAGKRYSPEDLAGLGEDDAAYLKDLVCALAILRLTAGRVAPIGEEQWRALREDTRERLRELERGERIFATAAAQEAGLPKTDGPRLADYDRLNLLVDRCRGYYPDRGQDAALGR